MYWLKISKINFEIIFIGKLIGVYVGKFDELIETEFMEYRLELLNLVKLKSMQDQETNLRDQRNTIECIYGSNVETNSVVLDLCKKLNDLNYLNDINKTRRELQIEMDVFVKESGKEELLYKIKVPSFLTPCDIIVNVMQKKLAPFNYRIAKVEEIIENNRDLYVLTACGTDEAFYGNQYPIDSYQVHMAEIILNNNLSFKFSMFFFKVY